MNKENEISETTIRRLLLIVVTVLLCICIKNIEEKLKSRLITFPFILLTGILVGYICYLKERKDIVDAIIEKETTSFFTILIPVLIYHMCIVFDPNLLAKCWGQIVIISIPGLAMNVIMVAIIFNRFSGDWSIVGFFIAITLAPIYPMDVLACLKNLSGTSKQLLTILQGESVVTTCLIFNAQFVMMETEMGRMSSWWDYMWFFLLHFVIGISLGCIFGKIFAWAMVLVSHPMETVVVSLLGPFGVHWVMATTCSPGLGLICLAVQGVMIAQKRRNLSKESRRFLLRFWYCFNLTCNSCGLVVLGVVVGYEIIKEADIQDMAFILLGYLINLMARFLGFLSLFYLLKYVGQGMTFKHLIVLVWGGIHSIINMSLEIETYREPSYRNFTMVALFHGTLTTCLTLLINVPTMPYLLNCLELDSLSLIKQANMNKCFKHVTEVRTYWISTLKLDRFYCDANWPFINEATTITHPLKTENIRKYEELENELQFEKLTICPACHKEATIVSTLKDLDDLINDARRRILKAKQVSYSRQYENGMLPVEAIRVLSHEIESAMETDFIMKTDNIIKLFTPPRYLMRFQQLLLRMFHDGTGDWFVRKPRIKFRKICYVIVFNSAFEYVMCIIIMGNTVLVIIELAAMLTEHDNLKFVEKWPIFFRIVAFFFFAVYLAEFVMKIMALSSIYIWKDGVVGYFRSKWRRFEFFFLIVSLIEVIIQTSYLVIGEMQANRSGEFAAFICGLGFLRMARAARVIQRLHPFLEECIDNRINNKLTLAYSVGKGYVMGEEDVLHLLPTIVLKHEFIEEMKQAVEADRLKIKIELSLLQREKPSVTANVKTREAIKTILNSMHEAVIELKQIGWVSEIEREMLMKVITARERKVNRLGFIPTPTAQQIFHEITWIQKNEKLQQYLYMHSRKVVFETEECACIDGIYTDGIFIIISGIFKMIYKSDDAKLRSLYKYGELPVIDYITSTDLYAEIEDFFSTGNTFGELAVLIDRPYACSIIAECRSQAYLIDSEFVREAMKMDDDPMNGLQARLWKFISLRLAYAILVNAPPYQAVSKKDIEYCLLRAVVPDLGDIAIFQKNDMIEDIVLINGLVADYNSWMIYYAPCYIPRYKLFETGR
ncbi:hypothetical protein WA026_000033 [Henosepilachna vigintioctopunctata]|uniref:Cyclic nucleotide-binding domain-containing protein n=1 Tax=Henosepilachna vigintioctopunctata TaxID=420089 RepID=A0AAW1UWA7_9CUCU